MIKRYLNCGALIAFTTGTLALAQTPAKVDFQKDVQPILNQHCTGCHGPTQQMNGFRLDRKSDALRGGTVSRNILPRESSRSAMYLRVAGNELGPQMPPTGALPAAQIEIIKLWIDQGAEWPDEVSGDAPPAPADPKAVGIMTALRTGDRTAFRKLLNDNAAAINGKGPGGATPLMYAALYGDTGSVRLLLETGADPNLRNDRGATALMWAANDAEKTRLLLARGADVNVRSDDGRSALLIAAGFFASDAVVKQLLARGGDPSLTAISLFGPVTPLAAAASVGNAGVMEMLIASGAEPKAAGFAGLANAMRADCAKCMDLLIKHVDARDRNIAAVLLAPPLGTGSQVSQLIDQGADVNSRDQEGNPLLMLVSSSDALPVQTVKILIDRGADVHAKGPKGQTALDVARLRGNTSIVEALLKAGAKEGMPAAGLKPTPKPAASPRDAVLRVLPLLQRSDSIFTAKSGCVSCHNNTLTAMTVAAARKNGIAVDEQTAQKQLKTIATFVDSWRERLLQGIGIPGDSDTVSYILLGMAAENYESDAATDAMALFLKNQQSPNGQWRIFAHRPPIESNDIQVTAASLRALQVYAPRSRRDEFAKAVQRAVQWLMKAEPRTAEERSFQILGLKWGGVSDGNAVVRKAVRDLVAEQRPDGGWAQIPSLASDAYATGQALVALKEAGMGATHPAPRSGVRYLLDNQLEDGSWYVKSRAIPIQPLFDGGFPHGSDQWVSAAASNWAALALALGADSSRE